MADEVNKAIQDTSSPGESGSPTKSKRSNKPMSNRIMLVVTIIGMAVLVFIIFSMAEPDPIRKRQVDNEEGRVTAAGSYGLTITDREPEPGFPDFITSGDEIIIPETPEEPALVLPVEEDKPAEEVIEKKTNVRVVVKEPSQAYQQMRGMLIAAMGSPSAVTFDETEYEENEQGTGTAEAAPGYGAPQSTGGDYGDIAAAFLGGGMGLRQNGPGMGGRSDNEVAMAHQDRNMAFINGAQNGASVADEYNPATRRPSISKYELKAGTVISGVLTSGINSDLPGTILAQVSENIYDSATGAFLLIPQGAKVLGEYDSHVVYGQHRVLVVWKRIIYPDGTSLNLGGLIGSDQAGYSGMKQKIDNHYSRLIGAALFASVFVAAGKIATEDDKDKNGNESTAAEAVMQQMSSLGARIAERNLNVAPTLRILPGYRFSIITTKDMAFAEPYYFVH